MTAPPLRANGELGELAGRKEENQSTWITVTIANLPVKKEIRSRKPDPPYCWQNKEALRQIERKFDNETRVRLACCAYFALTRIASDKQSEIFECKVRDVAHYMHYSYKEALEGIKLAELADVIHVERRTVSGTKENAPSIYALAHIASDPSDVVSNLHKVVEKVKTRPFTETLERTEKEQRKKREAVAFSSLKEAAAHFEPLFSDRPVSHSLSDLIQKKGKAFLTEKYCHSWLTREERRNRPKPPTEPIRAIGKEWPAEQPISLEEQAEYAAELAELKANMQISPMIGASLAHLAAKKTFRPPTEDEVAEEEERRRKLDAQREQIRKERNL